MSPGQQYYNHRLMFYEAIKLWLTFHSEWSWTLNISATLSSSNYSPFIISTPHS